MFRTVSPASPAQPQRGAIRHMQHEDYVFVRGTGSWSTDEADDHFAELDATLQRIRARAGVRVLVDLREAGLQSPEIEARMSEWTSRLYQEEDRVAIVLASSVATAQIQRVAIAAQRELFLSKSAAMGWLLSPALCSAA